MQKVKLVKNVIEFDKNVRFLGPHKFPDFDAKIQRLKDMGVSEFEARAALSRNNWVISLSIFKNIFNI